MLGGLAHRGHCPRSLGGRPSPSARGPLSLRSASPPYVVVHSSPCNNRSFPTPSELGPVTPFAPAKRLSIPSHPPPDQPQIFLPPPRDPPPNFSRPSKSPAQLLTCPLPSNRAKSFNAPKRLNMITQSTTVKTVYFPRSLPNVTN